MTLLGTASGLETRLVRNAQSDRIAATAAFLRAMGAGTAVIAWDVGFNREVLGVDGEFFGEVRLALAGGRLYASLDYTRLVALAPAASS